MLCKPLVSVIIPVYNAEKTIENCIRSLLLQTYKNCEFIFVNDGSTDNSKTIIENYKDGRLIVIDKKNGGPASSRNVGLDVAKGKYIAFVDSDDVVSTKYIETMLDKIGECDLCISSFSVFDESGNFIGKPDVSCDKIITEEEFWIMQSNVRFGWSIVPWNKLYSFHIFKELRFPKMFSNEDQYIVQDIISNCNKISVIEDDLYTYIRYSNSVMGSYSDDKRFDMAKALVRRLRYFQNKNYISSYFLCLNRAIAEYMKVKNAKHKKELKKEINNIIVEGPKNTSIKNKLRWKLELEFPSIMNSLGK